MPQSILRPSLCQRTTGQPGPREVLATWPHSETLVGFEVGDSTVTTAEDHEFWNVTDDAWQETQHIGEGDLLLVADGATVGFGFLLVRSCQSGVSRCKFVRHE